jgi:tripartite-type tricarboxylate transporter receptor subunit TctC
MDVFVMNDAKERMSAMNSRNGWRQIWLAASLVFSMLIFTGHVCAQAYPMKPIRMIVPFPPGGSTDVLGRVVGQKLAELLGQPVLVENRGGADGRLGMDALAKSAPDGYTILFCTTSTLSINPGLYAGKLPYDPDKAFVEIAAVASAPNILVATNTLPVKSVKEVAALAKTKSGGLNVASGATMHLLNARLFESKAGITNTTIPYKGTGPALTDLVGGQADIMFDQLTTSLPFVQEGRLKALAVTSVKRYPGLPDVPTMIEAGIADFDTTSWWGIIAPAGVSAGVVAKLNAEINHALTDAGVIAKIRAIGGVSLGGTPQSFSKLALEDRVKWAKVIKDYDIKPE